MLCSRAVSARSSTAQSSIRINPRRRRTATVASAGTLGFPSRPSVLPRQLTRRVRPASVPRRWRVVPRPASRDSPRTATPRRRSPPPTTRRSKRTARPSQRVPVSGESAVGAASGGSSARKRQFRWLFDPQTRHDRPRQRRGRHRRWARAGSLRRAPPRRAGDTLYPRRMATTDERPVTVPDDSRPAMGRCRSSLPNIEVGSPSRKWVLHVRQ